jgi:predicted transposase/invertase (TIGR01784 family)
LKAVYCIGILDFTFDDYKTEPEKSEVVHTIKLKNQNGKIFTINENQLKTRLDKWLYFIKYLEDFQTIPTIIADEVFNQAFEKAEPTNYENSLKIYRDLKGVIDTAFDEGKLEGKLEMARFMKSENEPIDKICKYTGLTKEDIDKL